MAAYKSFEDLPVWKNARELAVQVYRTTSKGRLRDDYGLRNQIQRAAVSVSSNIAEGFERGSKQESIQFLYVAKGSCGELRSQLFIANDIGYIDDTDSKNLLKSATNVSKQIGGFIEYLKTSKFKGQKYQTKQSEICNL
ncbi:MAG TPA: four helix bundle protein [Sedimentisphaerales bacterium]|nr:four helix bundle protein [Sedimentisphaerales bacterium]